jgi:hypothetical protein
MEIQYAIVGVVIAIAIFLAVKFIVKNGKKGETCSSCCNKNLCYKSNEEMECKSCSRVEKNDIK